ncbi:MAG TPA: rhomboid family intramembrane serine protease [Acidobacteriota bacterium]|nr:rhomboid family intramembrane serine protease [Acidobacteriota bacterium]
MDEQLVVAETYLSRKPAKASTTVGLAMTTLLCVASFLYWQDIFGLTAQLPGNPQAVFQGHEYWRLLTGLLVHADLDHFLSNAPGFAFLTGLIYGYYGWTACLVLTFAAGSAVNLMSLLTYPPDSILTGASGVVYLLAAFWLTMYVFLERRHGVAGRLMRGVGFSLVMLFPTALVPQVSYRTHAIGFAVGMALAILYFLKKKEYFRRFEIYEYDN